MRTIHSQKVAPTSGRGVSCLASPRLGLQEAICVTLRYFDRLDFPLTVEELSDYLYGLPASPEEVAEEIKKIKEVEKVEDFYCLRGREQLIQQRHEKDRQAKKMWKSVDRFAWIFSLTPFVRMVAVCNSLSYGNVTATSDIDLFVVVKNGRLGTARFFLKLFTQLFRMRVHHEKKAGRFCLSFFVTEKAMDLAPLGSEFDPHLAYFVHTMQPVFAGPAFLRFVHANMSWTTPYFKKGLPSDFLKHLKKERSVIGLQSLLELILWPVGGLLENFLWRLQHKKDLALQKASRSSTKSILLTHDVFKFHENDPREKIAKELF